MKSTYWMIGTLLLGLAGPVLADGSTLLGGALGGAAGAAIGESLGGRDGAVLGGALGGATGAAIGHDYDRREVRYDDWGGPRWEARHGGSYDYNDWHHHGWEHRHWERHGWEHHGWEHHHGWDDER